MARHVFLLSSIFALATWGFAFAQEESDEANVHYENLKVLEPLIGSYHGKAAVEALDVAWEVRTKYSWFGTKNILKEEFTLRGTDSNGGDLDDQEWSEPIINYFVWNQVTKRIELVRPMPWMQNEEVWHEKSGNCFPVPHGGGS